VRDELSAYLREVLAVPLQSQDQQLRLFKELALGGPQVDRLRARLAEVNLRLAVSVARKYHGRGLPLCDLIMESNVGLLRAIDAYDYRKGVRFSTYAVWWMRKAIVTALEAQAEPEW
jgi:DNA-directed RNA polymerase sigma subunit (sigma70/sigma32)